MFYMEIWQKYLTNLRKILHQKQFTGSVGYPIYFKADNQSLSWYPYMLLNIILFFSKVMHVLLEIVTCGIPIPLCCCFWTLWISAKICLSIALYQQTLQLLSFNFSRPQNNSLLCVPGVNSIIIIIILCFVHFLQNSNFEN